MSQGWSRWAHSSLGSVVLLVFVTVLCLGLAGQAGAMDSRPPGPLALAGLGGPFNNSTPLQPSFAQQDNAEGSGVIPNHYIVVLKGSVSHPGNVASAQSKETGGEVGFVYRSALKGYSATMSKADAEALESDPRVKYVTPDRTLGIESQTMPTGIERIFAPTDPSLDIDETDDVRVNANVAVIDSGIDYEHPDLNVVGRTNCVPAGENTNTEGEVEECTDGAGTDGNGHGTHVAGTIGALDNGFGVVGVAPGARLWSVRVLNNAGSGSFAWILAGVDWVTATRSDANSENDIDVANVSIGCGGLPCKIPPLDEAFTKSAEAGVVYAVAAGNEGGNASESTFGTSPKVITVSALADYDGKPDGKVSPTCTDDGADDTLASFSNYGKDVEVAAPGVCIRSTYKNGGYETISGTSMASPHVAGAAAILASKSHPKSLKDVEAIRTAIVANGNQEWSDTSGDGTQEALLDVGRIATGLPTIASETEATLRGRVRPAGQAATYRFEYGTSTAYGTNVPVPDANIGSGSNYVALSQTLKSLKGKTTYHYRITATIGAETLHGADWAFGTTKAQATTEAASEVHANDATLKGTVNPEGAPTSYYFEFGPSASYGRKAPLYSEEAGSGTAAVKVSAPVGFLTGSHTYHFRVVAKNNAGTTYGKDETFTTAAAQWSTRLLPKQPINPHPGTRPYDTALSGVSCVSPEDCMAVGNYFSFLGMMDSQHWDGSEWSAAPMAVPSGAKTSIVTGVSCSSQSWCVAAGYYSAGTTEKPEGLPLIETWDGVKWSAVSLPLPEGAQHKALNSVPLLGVSCASQSACMAVGEYVTESGEAPHLRPLVYRWDGEEWSLLEMTVPPEADLQFFADDVSCLSASWCMVVGGHTSNEQPWYHQVAEVWDGEDWEVVKQNSPNPQAEASKLHAGSCATQENCVALTYDVGMAIAGEGTPPAEHWDGKAWTRSSLPTVVGGEHADPTSVSCTAVDACTAVGISSVPSGGNTPVAYSWDGEEWSLQSTSEPRQEEEGSLTSPFSWFEDASCSSPSNCLAVGGVGLQNGEIRAMAQLYRAPGPKSRTDVATNVSGTKATLNATVNPGGLKTTYQLEYGESKAYGSALPASAKEAGSGSSDVAISETLTTLKPETTYHYRLVATNSEGTTYGEDRAFTTKSHTPVYTSSFGIHGTGEGQLNEPLGLAVDSTGNIWVADSENHRIQKFDQSGKLLLQFGSKGSANGQFNKPYALAIDSSGNVWVADTFNSRIQKFNSKGEFLAKYSTEGSGNGQLYRPYGVTFDSAGNLWVADTWNQRIQKFNSKGEYLSQFNTSASPADVAVDGSGKLWVSEYAANRIRRYDIEGKELLQVGGTKGTEPGQFDSPTGLGIDSEGFIWVEDSENDRLQEFNPKGEFILAIGESGSGAGQMSFPRDIGFDVAGNLWILDSSNSRIQKWSYLSAPKSTTEAATSVKGTQATLKGTVNPQGRPTGYYFEYGLTVAYGHRVPVSSNAEAGSGTSNVAVSELLTGLAGNTTYHFRLVADSDGGTTHGEDKTFTTLKLPKATTEAATSVEFTQATLNATVNPEGLATSYWFEYGPTTSYGTKIPVSPASVGSGTSNVAVNQTPTGLTQGATYHYRVVAESAAGIVNGADKTVITLKPPKATTESAVSVKATQATLRGLVNPEGSATSYWFEYGPTTSYGTKIPVSPASVGSGTTNVSVVQTPTGLTQGTTYHFRVVAESVAGTVNGADKSLTTLKLPKATTESATAVKATQATLNATVNPEGSNTSYYFEYGPTTSYGTKIPVFQESVGSGTSNVAVNQTPTGLTQGATYHYRVVAVSPAGTVNGADKTVDTLKPPKATTESATAVKATQATLNGTVNPEGSATSYYFEYGPTTSYGTKIPVSPASVGSGTSNVAVSQTPTGLTQGTTYHYRVVASGGEATINGEDKTLATLKVPKATTDFPTNIHATDARLNATINPEGSATSYYFEYGPTTSYGTKIPVSPVSVGSGTFNEAVYQTLTGLTQNATYHARVVAESAAGIATGSDRSFTTLKVPKATTEAATSVKATEATLNATVNPEGSPTVYWFEYGTTTSYGTKIPVSWASAGSGTSNVAVSQTPTGLSQSTTYHFRVVAESSGGTVNGEDKTFTTPVPQWTLQTTPNPSSNVYLEGVSCATGNECIAVGSKGGSALLAQRWNGTEWSTMTGLAEGALLTDISCGSSTSCLALPSSGLKVQRWNGSEWTTAAAATPVGAVSPLLTGISCTSSTFCIAAGYYGVSGEGNRNLTERWNGSEWTILTTPFEGGGNYLFAVACTSSTSCTAIGVMGAKPAALRWNGSEWSALAAPKEASTAWAALSCTAANACTAVPGNSAKVERWNGTEWTSSTVPTPEGGSAPKLYGVSCASASSCIAVGSYTKESKTVTLAESWNGSAWSVQSTPNLEGGGVLAEISCTAASKCTAAGYFKPKAGESKTVAERYE